MAWRGVRRWTQAAVDMHGCVPGYWPALMVLAGDVPVRDNSKQPRLSNQMQLGMVLQVKPGSPSLAPLHWGRARRAAVCTRRAEQFGEWPGHVEVLVIKIASLAARHARVAVSVFAPWPTASRACVQQQRRRRSEQRKIITDARGRQQLQRCMRGLGAACQGLHRA